MAVRTTGYPQNGPGHTAVFAKGRGFLTYWVPAGGEVVVLLRVVWAG